MAKLQALIFDVDGTLAETERDGHRLAFNQAFNQAQLTWDWSVSIYGQLLTVAGGKERIRFYLEQYNPQFEKPTNLAQFITQLHQSKTEFYQELLSQGEIPLRPGVKRLIEEARSQGIRIAIATTSALPNVLALLERTLDPTWFEVIAAGDIVPAKKPAPDIYNYVLDKLGLTPSECLVFEDSFHGLQAATKAGLKTIVTVNDYTKNQDFSEAILVLDHLGESDLPSTVIRGDLRNHPYVDLALLEKLV
ncbi:HAD-superfamily hydrolase, subfamily IA, variant 3 [Gloeothece citriformis PCC 7424]|uniref:HAD-superfamily hydrolase, subfamily IA, variant 3 n=1 Tax=Gloeothece citriformis (strain PCC 7424) TaxID=65393 RepID=B7KI76_GLOC7|nr:HAD family hydrolase [Gloeothece citriformis]ACK73563.1 HAD-superfamily hydrolase, subfamily IA, variant 3 [Gloeothece citriformis PCC 7424]